jgi:SpoVK/Ycf46/Vps4 family AAA+-type ATPase
MIYFSLDLSACFILESAKLMKPSSISFKRKFRLDPGLDLASFAKRCPFNYTGADFYALCSDAMLSAMSRKAEDVEVKIGETFDL